MDPLSCLCLLPVVPSDFGRFRLFFTKERKIRVDRNTNGDQYMIIDASVVRFGVESIL